MLVTLVPMSMHAQYKLSEGLELKEKDYTTWAIWRSGLLINLCKTLIELRKLELYREKIEDAVKRIANDELDVNVELENLLG